MYVSYNVNIMVFFNKYNIENKLLMIFYVIGNISKYLIAMSFFNRIKEYSLLRLLTITRFFHEFAIKSMSYSSLKLDFLII